MTDQVTHVPAGHPPIVFDRDSGVDLTTYSDVEEMLRSRSFGMEGSYQDSLRPFVYDGTPPAMVSRAAAHERPGRYTVEVRASGHVDWHLQNVLVEPGECHVRTVNLEARLQRSP